MGAPRTAREALAVEMLGEIDTLLARCEALPATVAALEAQLATSTATLDAAGERYRMTIVAFTEQAKDQVASYLERRAGEISVQLADEQREAIVRAVEAIAAQAGATERPFWPRIAEAACVAAATALFTVALVSWFR